MDDNKTLREENVCVSYVIVAERDGVKKYISKNFPYEYQYSVRLDKAKRFPKKEGAERFISVFGNIMNNPEIRMMERCYRLV